MVRPARLIFVMCVVEVLGMLGISTLPALLPEFIQAWQLSNTEAGWLNALFFAGYMVLVPVLVAATDRIDPRQVYLWSMVLNVLALGGFAVGAHGFWSALPFNFFAGVALAGTYMPGLKALSDRITGPAQSRAVSFYTASFGIGLSLSFYLSEVVAAAWGWRWAFGAAALGAAVALGAAWAVLPMKSAAAPVPHGARLFNFLPVLRNRQAMAYSLAYACHSFELFGLRSWMVVYLTHNLQQTGAAALLSPPSVAAVVTLFGLPASVTGNELALRFGRRRVVTLVMFTSAVVGIVLGLSSEATHGLVLILCGVYAVTVAMDSSAITAGAIQQAQPGLTGTTMAVHSAVGFAGAFLGPLVFGVVLDAFAYSTALSWALAFGAMSLAVAGGPVCIAVLHRDPVPAAD